MSKTDYVIMRLRLFISLVAFFYGAFMSWGTENPEMPLGQKIIERNNYPKSVKPLLGTHWTQNSGENCLLPYINSAHTIHAKTGCGATAMGQVMRFWKYPEHGFGKNYYYWDEVSGEEQTLYADFQSSHYDWDSMIEAYVSNPNATEGQLKAVGALMYDIAVALQMKLNDKTPTQIEYIHTALKCFFGYNPHMRLLRMVNGAYTMEEWLSIIYSELAAGRPIIMGGTYDGEYGTANHIFVADGYDEDGKVHLNLGKGKTSPGFNSDTYYDLTKSGETYNQDLRMIIGISPQAIEAETTVVHVGEAGALRETLGGEKESRKVCRLKITGTINKEDIAWLKELSNITTGQLSYLDLSECDIDGRTIDSHAFGSCYTLQEIVLPDNLTEIGEAAFAECYGLYKVNIPKNLNSLKRYAFHGCRYLRDISLPSTLTANDGNPFGRVKLDKLAIDNDNKAYKVVDGAIVHNKSNRIVSAPLNRGGTFTIPFGIKTIGTRAFQGCDFIDQIEIPSTVENLYDQCFDCTNIQHVYSYAQEPCDYASFHENAFQGTLHVPVGCKDAYKTKGWEKFVSVIDDLDMETEFISSATGKGNNECEFYNLAGYKVETVIPGRVYVKKQNGISRLLLAK